MAAPEQYYTFRKIAEGGLSRAKTDSVSKNSKNFAPGTFTYKGVTAKDWHTNKGIIYPTFKEIAPLVGINPTADNFFKMTDQDWKKIFNKIWERAGGFENKSTALANIIFQSRWGTGPAALTIYLDDWYKEYFGIEPKTFSAIAALNNKAFENGEEKKLFDFLWNKRYKFLEDLGDKQPDNKKGWLSSWKRFNAFNQQYLDPLTPIAYVPSDPGTEGIETEPGLEKRWYERPITYIIGGSVLLATAGFIVYKRRKRKKETLTYNFAA
jgi:hypothetical protein